MSIAAMVASIKFNDRRNKREAFSHINGNIDSQSKGIKIEPISEEALQEIRNELKKQRLVVFKKQLFVTSLLIVVLTSILIYLM